MTQPCLTNILRVILSLQFIHDQTGYRANNETPPKNFIFFGKLQRKKARCLPKYISPTRQPRQTRNLYSTNLGLAPLSY